MSYILSESDFRAYTSDFAPVSSVSRALGANIGAVWKELLSLEDDTIHKVSGFVSRGSNVYALVSESYRDEFNLISWVSSHIDFSSKVVINPFNYSLVFGEGSLPRNIEEILEEINSVRSLSTPVAPVVAPVVSSPVSPVVSSVFDEGYDGEATSVLSEDFYAISGDGFEFAVYDEGVEYVLGRGSSASFHLVGKGISRNHLKFRYEGGALQVFDLGSTNGTRVNGGRIPSGSWVVVPNGSSIRVGRVTMSVSLREE